MKTKVSFFSKKLFCGGTGTVHNICLLGDSFPFHFLFVCLLSICSASTISSSYSFLASIFGGAREEKREREKERDRDRDRDRQRALAPGPSVTGVIVMGVFALT